MTTKPRWSHAQPNSLYFTAIMPDPEKRKRYNVWIRQISGDVAAMNRWARETMNEPARLSR